MKKTLRFLFLLLILSFSIYYIFNNFIGYRSTAHQKYSRSLSPKHHDEAAIKQWKKVAQRATNEVLYLDAPVKLFLEGNKHFNEAWGYRLQLPAGVVLNVNMLTNLLPEQYFVDLFFVEANGEIDYLWSKNEGGNLAYPVLETGEYQLRIQPALGIDFNFDINLFWSPIYAIFPVEGKGNRAIQSVWGDPRDGGKRKHEGIDIFAKKGTPLLAVCDGEIDRVKNGGLGGKSVWLYDAENGQSIYYAHCDEQLVTEGQRVKAGEPIATVGNTGNARTTPPHVHLGIYPNRMGAIDPIYFVKKQPKETDKISVDKDKVGLTTSVSSMVKIRTNLADKQSETMSLTPSASFQIVAAVGRFYQIRLPQGTTGFLEGKYLK
jgi:murein DD-endopeptidase MepM/ murein hydrolase activator NlpD